MPTGPAAAQPPPSATPSTPAAPGSCPPGAAPLRRLNHAELDNTVRDLFGDSALRPSAGLPPDDRVLGFDNQAAGLAVSPPLAQAYFSGAEALSERVTATPAALVKLLGCDPSKLGEDACVQRFVEPFLRRAFRRPASAAEVASYLRTYTSARAGNDLRAGVRQLIERAVQAPAFLYRLETGGTPDAMGRVRLPPHELAARVSYALVASMPDDQLATAADTGALANDAELDRQIRRLLADPRARDNVARFAEQWLRLARLDATVKDDKLFPTFTSETRAALKLSVRRFVLDVIFDGKGDLATLLSAPHGFANDRTAGLFGLPPITSKEPVRVDLPPAERPGLLGHPAFMAMTAGATASNPVKRGVWVREQLLGTDLPPPLPDVDTRLPSPRPDATTRERYTVHATNPACASCHRLIDPIGFGLESYDAVGAWRTTEKTRPLDLAGEIVDSDVAGRFTGPAELARKLAASEDARLSLAHALFRFTLGRAEQAADACALGQARAASARGGHKVQELLVALAESDALRFRKAGVP
jgi:hypothetical protein